MVTRYRWEILQQLFSMFEYGSIPFRKEFLEWQLIRVGYVAACRKDDKILIGSISSYEQDEYGLPLDGTSVDFFTRWGYQSTGVIGKDIIIGYNNTIRTPVVGLDFYAEQFERIDTAISANVKHSMVSSVPVARNENVKRAIVGILERIQNGEILTIADDNVLDTLVREGGLTSEPVTMLHFTQPEQIERVQYLSKLYDDLLRRLWTTYGHSMNSTGKMAQVNEMELQGYESYSSIIPWDMYEARKNFIEDCNAVFGTNWTVDFGKAWKHLKNNADREDDTEEVVEGEEDKLYEDAEDV